MSDPALLRSQVRRTTLLLAVSLTLSWTVIQLQSSVTSVTLAAIAGPGIAGIGSTVLLGASAIAERGRPRVPAGMGRRLFIGGLVGVAIYNGIFFFALSLAPAIDGAAIMPVTSPIATAGTSIDRSPSGFSAISG